MSSQRETFSEKTFNFLPCLDDPNLELAVAQLRVRHHRPQPLRHVRPVPPVRGPHRVGFTRSDRQGLGYFWFVQALVESLRKRLR